MNDDIFAELDEIARRVGDLERRIELQGRELDRLRVDVLFWTTVLEEYAVIDE